MRSGVQGTLVQRTDERKKETGNVVRFTDRSSPVDLLKTNYLPNSVLIEMYRYLILDNDICIIEDGRCELTLCD